MERYPAFNLIKNGEFENFEGWVYNQNDTEFRIIYSWSFEGGTAILINPKKENPTGYMEQQIDSVVTGVYEFIFFYSSKKGKKGDVLFSIRDDAEKYWNETTWVIGEYYFNETHNDLPGYYKLVQKTVIVPSVSNITIRFKNKNGNGVLIDGIRFGNVVDPAIRLYITVDPELFYNNEIRYDKKFIYNGFKQYYIKTDMESILEMIHPAGVHVEMTVLNSRLNLPWDRMTIDWSAMIKPRWHVLYDGTKKYNHGSITFLDLYYDGSFNFDKTYTFGSKKIIRTLGPNDLTYKEVLSSYKRKYSYNKIIESTRRLYFNGHIGFNSRYNFSGITVSSSIGLITMIAMKEVFNQKTAKAKFNNQFNFDGSIKFDGMYTTYEPGIEIYPLKEV